MMKVLTPPPEDLGMAEPTLDCPDLDYVSQLERLGLAVIDQLGGGTAGEADPGAGGVCGTPSRCPWPGTDDLRARRGQSGSTRRAHDRDRCRPAHRPPAARRRVPRRPGPGTRATPTSPPPAPTRPCRARPPLLRSQRTTLYPRSSILTWGLCVRALGRTRIVRPQAQLLRQAEDHVTTRLTTRYNEKPVMTTSA